MILFILLVLTCIIIFLCSETLQNIFFFSLVWFLRIGIVLLFLGLILNLGGK